MARGIQELDLAQQMHFVDWLDALDELEIPYRSETAFDWEQIVIEGRRGTYVIKFWPADGELSGTMYIDEAFVQSLTDGYMIAETFYRMMRDIAALELGGDPRVI